MKQLIGGANTWRMERAAPQGAAQRWAQSHAAAALALLEAMPDRWAGGTGGPFSQNSLCKFLARSLCDRPTGTTGPPVASTLLRNQPHLA